MVALAALQEPAALGAGNLIGSLLPVGRNVLGSLATEVRAVRSSWHPHWRRFLVAVLADSPAPAVLATNILLGGVPPAQWRVRGPPLPDGGKAVRGSRGPHHRQVLVAALVAS